MLAKVSCCIYSISSLGCDKLVYYSLIPRLPTFLRATQAGIGLGCIYKANKVVYHIAQNIWGWKFSQISWVREQLQKISPAKFQVHNRYWKQDHENFIHEFGKTAKYFILENFRLYGMYLPSGSYNYSIMYVYLPSIPIGTPQRGAATIRGKATLIVAAAWGLNK